MKLYDSRSEDQFLVKYERGTLDVATAASGICLGQSLVWCRLMLDGRSPSSTKPSYGAAAAVATKYLWALKQGQSDDNALIQASDTVNLVSQSVVEGNVYTHFWQITHNPGVYLVTIRGHAMAAGNQNDQYYFFDPSDGLYEFDSTIGFNRKMLEYQNYLGSRKFA